MKISRQSLATILTLGTLLAVWWAVTSGFGIVNPLRLPSPGDIWVALHQIATTGPAGGTLWMQAAHSLQLVAKGFAVAIVPGNLIVREDFLKEHAETVAKFLAVFPRGVTSIRANRAEAVKLMDTFYKEGGVNIPEKALNAEIDRRPMYHLEEQLKLFDRAAGASTVDGWFTGLGEFLKGVGTLQAAPDTKGFLTDEVLKRIMADPNLRDFAMGK